MRVWTDVTEVTAILPDGDGCLVAGRYVPGGTSGYRGYRFHGVFRLSPSVSLPGYCFSPSRRPMRMSWVPRADGPPVLQLRTIGASSAGWRHDALGPWERLWHAPLLPAVGFNKNGKPLFLVSTLDGSFAALSTAAARVPRRPKTEFQYDRAVVIGSGPTIRLVGNVVDLSTPSLPYAAMGVLFDTAKGRWLNKSTTTHVRSVIRIALATAQGALLYARDYTGTSHTVVVTPAGVTAPAPAYLPLYDCWGTLDWVGDAAAWLEEGVLKVATADGVTLSLQPNPRRRLRGCVLAPDGQTVWAFDTGAVYQIDVG